MNMLNIIDHPIIRHHLGILRDLHTSEPEFRTRLGIICELMFFDVMRSLPTRVETITTPLESTQVEKLDRKLIFVSILRAGLGMQNAFLRLYPDAAVGHLGFYRNEETLEPVQYYYNLPESLSDYVVILLDPMLATGGSLNAAISLLKKHHAKEIKCVTLVSAQPGIDLVHKNHADIDIFTAALDRELNEKGYILPGLGDAGDRQFRT